jgi:serine/threonine protein kinase
MINQTISHYRITGQLGSGGMGVVYEAQDLDLGRRVALKFLPPALARDQNSLDRFLLEARTASALNHPNICTIYAVEKAGTGDETQVFIAMELLEGQSLDQKLVSGPLAVGPLFDIAIQLADALDAAHAKGIIHRDIKPANIFLTQRGQVKVLDFGLAKLARPEMAMETIGATQDAPAHLTSPGATVGTISYMSPEQARGEELDTRTDLFSLGTVIYQMATGRLPFSGATSAVVFHAILELDPAPVQQLNSRLPPQLQEILEKSLEKDRELRYQSAADLRGDLRRLKRDTDSGRKSPVTPSSTSGVSTLASAPPTVHEPAQRSSSSSAVVSAVRQNKFGFGVTAGVVLVLIAAAAYGVYAFLTRTRPMPFQNISATKVTDTGDAALATVSPDGKYILSMVRHDGLASLWLRNVPTNSNTQVQPPADVYYIGLRFSPNGNYFYFERSDPGNSELKHLYRAPLLGGEPLKLLSDIDSNITFSPDGKQFAFLRLDNPDPGKFQLIAKAVEGGEERVVTSGPEAEAVNHPAWSLDGKTIMGSAIHAGDAFIGLVTVDVKTGKRQPFAAHSDRVLQHPEWMPDGRGVLVLVRERSFNFNRNQIGFVSYPEGKFSTITRDTNDYLDLSVAADGHLLSTVLGVDRWNLFVMPASGSGDQARQVASVASSTNFSWTRDNQWLADQNSLLKQINPESGEKTTLTAAEGSPAGDPAACPDGRFVLFDANNQTNENIWRMDASGGNLKRLTDGRFDLYPLCSPDGQWAYYLKQGDERTLARVPIDGGASQTISALPIEGIFDLSPDGKRAAFVTLEHHGEHEQKLALVATDSGQLINLVPFERPNAGIVRFTHDGNAVTYPVRKKGIDNLWLQPLDGSPGKQITDFKADRIYDYRWSFDGSRLALVRGHTDSDVVLIRDAQQ